jgi:hypothetical protein
MRDLTWDSITRRGYEFLSIYSMCFQEVETTNHLFNPCMMAYSLWDRGAFLFRTLERIMHDIRKTIEY